MTWCPLWCKWCIKDGWMKGLTSRGEISAQPRTFHDLQGQDCFLCTTEVCLTDSHFTLTGSLWAFLCSHHCHSTLFLQVPFSEKDTESSRIKEEKEVGRQGLPWWLTGKEPTCQSRRHGSFLGQEDPLEKEMATHSSILVWRIPWTEKPGRLQFMGSQKSDLATKQQTTGHVL